MQKKLTRSLGLDKGGVRVVSVRRDRAPRVEETEDDEEREASLA